MPNPIGWCDKTINLIHVIGESKVWPHGHHCTHCSPGCDNCWAEGMNMRFGTGLPYDGRDVKFGLDLSVFDGLPKKGCRVFVQSMGDLFHRCVPFWKFDKIMAEFMKLPHHQYLILTKRPDRMKEFMAQVTDWGDEPVDKNTWLGVTVCNASEKHKIDTLRDIPAAVRFVSFEPTLGDLGELDLTGIHWVILGGESGSKARPMHPIWARGVRDQCLSAGVPFFFKQWGQYIPENTVMPLQKEWSGGFCYGECRETTGPKKDIGKITPYAFPEFNEEDGWGPAWRMVKVGKKKAGHLLDGVEHRQFPGGVK